MQDPMIEKYRQELMEFSRKNPRFAARNPAVPQKEQPKPEQVRRNGNPRRADFAPETGKTCDPEQRLRNTAMREAVQQTEQQVPTEAETEENPREAEFAEQGEELPPYNNGKVTEYDTQTAFLAANRQTGFLRVQVSAADQAYPIQNAEVVVSKHFAQTDSVFFTDRTDASGIMSRISLPAPDRSLASAPSALQPYATYDINVSHPGFAKVNLKNCVVFDGIETIQQVELIPTAANGMPQNAEGGD